MGLLQNFSQKTTLNKVVVKLHTCLRSTAGKEEIELPLTSGSSLESLLERLSREYPKLEPLLKGEAGYLHLMILVNNNNVGPLTKENLQKTVSEGDVVAILEPCAAG